MTGLGDFSSYDLGRVLEALRADVAELPDQYAGPALRRACVQLLSFDHRWGRCWDDPSFLARYTWLREALAIDSEPALAEVVRQLSPLVDDLVAGDQLQPGDTPF
jgi:hypothetical protein